MTRTMHIFTPFADDGRVQRRHSTAATGGGRYGKRVLGHSLAFFAVIAASGMAAEPNDTLLTATPTGLTAPGSVNIENEVLGDGKSQDRDVDLYSFVIDGAVELPLRVTIELSSSSANLDAYLRLFDASGVELANNDDRAIGEADPRIDTFLLVEGVYFVGVSTTSNPRYNTNLGGSGRSGTGGTYDLSIAVEAQPVVSSPHEPNDGTPLATPMGSESFVVESEFIGDGEHGRRDVDIYKLDLNGPARIDVEVRSDAIGSSLDPVVRLRNCTDSTSGFNIDPCMLAADDDLPSGSADASVSVGLLEAMDVFIIVSGAGNRRYDPTIAGSGEIGSVGFYDLIVNVTPVQISATGDEPNDALPNAVRLSPFLAGRPDVHVIDGVIGDGAFAAFQGDRDVYLVTSLEEMRLLTIDVATESIGSTLDPMVMVYDANGNRIASNDNHGGLTDSHLEVPLSCVPVSDDAVSAYVMVMGTQQRPPIDPFEPTLATTIFKQRTLNNGLGSTGPYRITLGVTPIDQVCGDEPNDTLLTATDSGLVDQGVFTCRDGLIGDGPCGNPALDLDVWSFRVTHPPVVLAAFLSTCQIDDLGCHRLHLFDNNATLLAFMDTRFNTPEDRTLRAAISTPGTFHLAVSGGQTSELNPTILCNDGGNCIGRYDLIFTLSSGETGLSIQNSALVSQGESEVSPQLFATRLDDVSNVIDVLDADTAQPAASFSAPEPRFGGLEGLAFDGTDLYYLGTGWFPRLYRMDPTNGDILDEFILWTGSGFYSDAVMLGGELFLLDFRADSIHVIDPIARRFKRTLPVWAMNGVSISGGLAALAGPNRLYISDAFNTRSIYEIDPLLGRVTNVISPASNRPTALAGIGTDRLLVGDWQSSQVEGLDRNGVALGELALTDPPGSFAGYATFGPFGDADTDGDADMLDIANLQKCFGQSLPVGCAVFDFDGSTTVDLSDFILFHGLLTGP